MNINISDARNIDILKLCKSVLAVGVDRYDASNGGYNTYCPFCDAKEEGSDWIEMDELSHSADCAYLIAKDLSTGYLK